MQITVLGTAGGEAPGLSLTGFLLGESVLLDAGTVGLRLHLDAQKKIRHVLLTHAHLDHIHALPFLLDNLIGRVEETVCVYGTAEVLSAVQQHLFNNRIWPDFTKLPSADRPIVTFCPLEPRQVVTVGAFRVEGIPVQHSFSALAYLISDEASTVAFTGDTGPVQELWERLGKVDNLRAIFMECSFSKAKQDMALVTNHLSTAHLRPELAKMGRHLDVPVYLYHLKPDCAEEIEREVEQLGFHNMIVPKPGDSIHI